MTGTLALLALQLGLAAGPCSGMEPFREEVLRLARQAWPDRPVGPGPEPDLLLVGTLRVSLSNLMADTCPEGGDGALPAARLAGVRHFLAQAVRIAERRPLKDRSWAEVRPTLRLQLSPERLQVNARRVARPFAPGVLLVVVADEEGSYGYVVEELLGAWKVTADQVLAEATRNHLAQVPPGRLRGDDDGTARLLFIGEEDGYDAARLLLPEVRARLAARLGDPFLAGIPSRDFLVAWSAALGPREQRALRESLRDDHASSSHPLSGQALRVWSDGRVEPAP